MLKYNGLFLKGVDCWQLAVVAQQASNEAVF